MTDELAEIERVAGALLRVLSSGARRTLMRRMARELGVGQRKRIAAQQAPDGSAFAPRKKKETPISGRGTACFLYPSGGSGDPRRVIMKSFTWGAGQKMTGFDIDAGAIRTFEFSKIVKWLPVPPEHANRGAGKLRRRGGIRRRNMFRRLSSARFLKTAADDQSLWVGFSGKASAIANVHQRGLRDRPSIRAKPMDYPMRELLGMTKFDRETLLNALYKHLT